MLNKNIPFPLLFSTLSLSECASGHSLQFLHEHRSEWADSIIDAYATAAIEVSHCSLPESQVGGFSDQVILPMACIIACEEVSNFYSH